MDDLRARAKALLRGACCFSKTEPKPTAVGLIRQYADNGRLTDTQVQEQLPQCVRFAETQATDRRDASGPASDVQCFYEQAAALLREIDVDSRGDLAR